MSGNMFGNQGGGQQSQPQSNSGMRPMPPGGGQQQGMAPLPPGFNPYANMFNSQPSYSANNFIQPQVQSSKNLSQQYQNNPAQTLAAFSPAAFQQMLSNFFPSNMTQPSGPSGTPAPGNDVLTPFNQAPAQQEQAAPAPQVPAAQPQQGAPDGLFIPEWGRSVSPAEVGAMGNVPPEVQNVMQTYMGNLNMPQGPDLANNPWVKLNWNLQNK